LSRLKVVNITDAPPATVPAASPLVVSNDQVQSIDELQHANDDPVSTTNEELMTLARRMRHW
jgi:hypothetical protein